MIAPFRILLCSMLAMLALSACAGGDNARGPVVLAPSSMTEVMEELADDWAAKGHARPVLSIAGTPSLARQIEAGAPADLVISADIEWMNWLEEQGLVQPASRQIIAGNALVYVMRDMVNDAEVAVGAKVPLYGGKLAMGDPDSVPAGRYAKAALQAAGLWDGISASVVPTENVRAALVLVQRGEAQTAIVYSSDAAAAGSDIGALPFRHELPAGMTIVYPAALLAGASNANAGQFLAYLAGPDAAAILCRHGFTMPEGRDPC